MKLSPAAEAFLNGALMEAADLVKIGDGYVSVLTPADVDQIRAQLQAWRDSLQVPPVSRDLVQRAFDVLSEGSSMPHLARARLLLSEALS